jgi:hypothetical protein
MNEENKKPIFTLSAIPNEQVKIKNFFSADEKSVKFLLEHPGELRYAGWDLQTLDQAKLIKGDYFEVVNGDRKKIHLYEDGNLVLLADATNNFLCWGRGVDVFLESPRLNPIAVIELTYNFVFFYKKIISHFEQNPEKIKFIVRFNNTVLENGNKLYLNPYSVGSYSWVWDDEKYLAPENNMKKEVECSIDEIINEPEKCVFQLVNKIYGWFGMTVDKIPLVGENEKKEKIININEIIKK